MKLKLAKRMQWAKSRELDRARADLARVETKIRAIELQLEQAREKVRALHTKEVLRSSELELGHQQCKQLEQELQAQYEQREIAKAALVTSYHHKERSCKVLEKVQSAHDYEQRKKEQQCNDDRSLEHLKKLA